MLRKCTAQAWEGTFGWFSAARTHEAASRVVLVAPTMAASRFVLVALAARPALAAVAGGYPSGPSRVAPAIVGNWGDAWTVLWPFFAVWLGTGLAVAYYALGKALRARQKPLSKTPVKARRSSTVTVAPPQENFSTAQDVAGATRRKSASSVDLEGVELSPTRNPVLDDAVDDEAPAAAPEKIEMRGLRETKAGTAAYVMCLATTASLFALVILCIVDYYVDCQMKGIDNLCFYGKYPIFGNYAENSRVFFAAWFALNVWLAVAFFFKNDLRDFFREPCALDDAKLVRVWIADDEEQLNAESSALVRGARAVQHWLQGDAPPGHGATVPVLALEAAEAALADPSDLAECGVNLTCDGSCGLGVGLKLSLKGTYERVARACEDHFAGPPAGRKYVVVEATRYVFDGARFERARVDVPTRFQGLDALLQRGGLRRRPRPSPPPRRLRPRPREGSVEARSFKRIKGRTNTTTASNRSPNRLAGASAGRASRRAASAPARASRRAAPSWLSAGGIC